jgi:D-amino-acid dehydrogenase
MSQTLARPDGRDITIVGAGIIGLCSAIELLQKGFQVIIIDKAEPGQGASYGNAGVVSPWSMAPQSMPGLWRKVPGWLLDPLGPVVVSPRYLPRMAYWGTRFLLQGRRTQVEKNSQAMARLIGDCIPLYQQLLADTGAQDLLRDSY